MSPRPDNLRTPILGILCLSLIAASACGPDPTPQPFGVEIRARVTVLNKSREMHVLRVRQLRREVQLDCEQVSQAPSEYLPDEAFGPPVRWTLFSDQEIGLGLDSNDPWQTPDANRGPCNAALIQSDTVPDIVAFWDTDLEIKLFQFDPDIPEYVKPDAQTIVLRGDYDLVEDDQIKPYRLRPCEDRQICGQRSERVAAEIPAGASYFWESIFEAPLHFEREWRPDERPAQVPPRCRVPGPGQALVWEPPIAGAWVVEQVEHGIDGCHTLRLHARSNPERRDEHVICAPVDSLRALTARSGRETVVEFEIFESTDRGLLMPIRYYRLDGTLAETARLYLTRGDTLPRSADATIEAQPRPSCQPTEAACGQVEVPVDMRVSAQAGPKTVRPGEAADLGETNEVHLVRAVNRVVTDAACAEDPIADFFSRGPATYIEAVTVIRD